MKAIVLCICLSGIAETEEPQVLSRNGVSERLAVATAIGEPIVTSKALEWRYQVRNASEQDIWLCASVGEYSCEAFMAASDETLLIRRRFAIVPERHLAANPSARYVRVPSGGVRTELMSFRLPIQPQYVFSARREERTTIEYGVRLVLEIGYYAGDLPGIVFELLSRPETVSETYSERSQAREHGLSHSLAGMPEAFLGSDNEGRGSKREWISVPYTWGGIKGERVLRLSADGLRIPYLEQDRSVERPGLSMCTRMEMKFKRPAIECLFPFSSEQDLLSPGEKQYLHSLDTVVISDRRALDPFIAGIRKGIWDAFVWDHGVTELKCYGGDQHVISLMMYNGLEIVMPWGQAFAYEHPEGLRSLRMATPEIRSLDARVQCGTNLHDMWYRLRLYHRVRAASSLRSTAEMLEVYPRPEDWCRDISFTYSHLSEQALMRAYQCPSASKGKCHYAMNPNCKYESPADMVLLFETKAGWNKHGGPKTFTFDNHDPRGGLVLLNDGTVKFIRTEEELQQLRWK